jgi:hypothetical protein
VVNEMSSGEVLALRASQLVRGRIQCGFLRGERKGPAAPSLAVLEALQLGI